MISSDKSMTVAPEARVSGMGQSLWIRTKAGPQIGFGHLKRCLILAEELQDCCTPLFLLDEDDSWSREQIIAAGWSYRCGVLSDIWSSNPDPKAILIDTRITAGLDSLIVAAKSRGIPVTSIHDLGLSPLPSDVVIDGSIAPLASGAVTGNAVYCGGTDYMVLDPAFNMLHRKKRQIRERIRSVIINLGGGNSEHLYLKVLQGLRLWSDKVEVIGVPGFIQWGQDRVLQEDVTPNKFRWESRNIEQLLFEADLAITAGGLAAYEALCAGTPLLSLSYDVLQQITITALAGKGACVSLGQGNAIDPLELSRVLSAVDTDTKLRKHLSSNGRKIVDGRGLQRVSHVIRKSIRHSSNIAADRWSLPDVRSACF